MRLLLLLLGWGWVVGARDERARNGEPRRTVDDDDDDASNDDDDGGEQVRVQVGARALAGGDG